jgi:ribokinase
VGDVAVNGEGGIAILGVFVADAAFRTVRRPRSGETVLGESFALGPGGKGSNQAVAAGRLGARVRFVTRLGDDAFAELAERTWREAGVEPVVTRDPASYTGAACIVVDAVTGDNAIVVCPGAGGELAPADVDAAAAAIAGSAVFMTQLEQPIAAAVRGLEIARAAGVTTILDPAPAVTLEDELLALADILTPNEGEAAALTGREVASVDDARRAGDALLARGAGKVVLTLGAQGVLVHGGGQSAHIPAVDAGPVVDTTGAGDAFNGGLAAALARGDDLLAAARFGNRVAAVAVTRHGTAAAMPSADEVLGRSS